MKIKFDVTAILATFAILYCNAGVLGFIKGSFFVTMLAYGSVFLWLLIAFMNDRVCLKHFLSISLPVVVFWFFLEICSFFVTDQLMLATKNTAKNILFLLIFVTMYIYYSPAERKTGRKFIVWAWFLDVIISSVYTLYRLIDNPMLSRILAVGDKSEYLGATVSTAGVLGYASIYGLVFAVIALYRVIKDTKGVRRIAMLLCLILFIYTVIQAQFFIALILAVLGLLVDIIWEENNAKKRYLRLLIIVPSLLLGIVLLLRILPIIVDSGVLPSNISGRLRMLYETSSYANDMSMARTKVYLQSLAAIGDSCGIGLVFIGDGHAGGHSEILDLIANYGFGFAGLFGYGIWRIKRYIGKAIPAQSRRNYNIVWLMYIIMSLLNPSLWYPTTICVFLMIPLIYSDSVCTVGEYKGENHIDQSWN